MTLEIDQKKYPENPPDSWKLSNTPLNNPRDKEQVKRSSLDSELNKN